jgi:cytosine/adenosine deaminase-related metal-dependent hydrolase
VLRGLAEVVAGGATTAAEIATVAWGPKQLLGELVDCTIFWEQIGLRSDRLLPITEKAGRWVEAIGRRCWAWKPGLSPHAPYSAHPELVAELSRLSASAQVPLAMHLAESQEELELLESGGGPLVDLLKELQAWAPEAIPRGVRPMDYLRTLAKADRALVAHGNFLSPDEIAFLGAHADRMSVVFCPRTHIHFGHPRYPLGQMAAAGVNVALGTDSRASSPDLSLLEELRVVAARFPDVAPETVLNMGALAGARALGLESELGSLSPGKLANLTVVELPDRSEDDPFSLLFDSTKPVQMTCRRGRWTPATN